MAFLLSTLSRQTSRLLAQSEHCGGPPNQPHPKGLTVAVPARRWPPAVLSVRGRGVSLRERPEKGTSGGRGRPVCGCFGPVLKPPRPAPPSRRGGTARAPIPDILCHFVVPASPSGQVGKCPPGSGQDAGPRTWPPAPPFNVPSQRRHFRSPSVINLPLHVRRRLHTPLPQRCHPLAPSTVAIYARPPSRRGRAGWRTVDKREGGQEGGRGRSRCPWMWRVTSRVPRQALPAVAARGGDGRAARTPRRRQLTRHPHPLQWWRRVGRCPFRGSGRRPRRPQRPAGRGASATPVRPWRRLRRGLGLRHRQRPSQTRRPYP